MEQRDEELVITLLPQYPELKAAYEHHKQLKAQVEALQSKSTLSDEEELEKKNLQKLKLAEKDRIMQILAEHRGEPGSEQTA